MLAVFASRSADAVISAYNAAGDMLETHEHKGDEVIKSEVGIKN
jgi:hypothetical protein